MLFTSLSFLMLLSATFALYYLPFLARFQVLILIVASFVFYASAKPWLLAILVLSCAVNAVSSFGIFRSESLAAQRGWAVLGVAVNLGLLVFFKYSRLIFQSLGGDVSQVQGIGGFLLTIPLPIGISFFTFQGISLVIDTFRWKKKGEPIPFFARTFWRHFYNTTFFKAFFPQLIAGPIVKAHQFLPQIGPKRFSELNWEPAFRFLVTGYFLKMVIADNLKDQTFWIAPPYFLGYSTINLAGLLFGYSMQIFADFAGYSLIALGLAEIFGYRLPQNFRFPYVSRTFSEFWTRWHISLSTWLREYLYIPLGGNRKGKGRTYFNLFTVMFLGGLWHGAAWSYAVWGTFHGLALAAERLLQGNSQEKRSHWALDGLRMVFVFAFVTLAWLLFKLPHFGDVIEYVKAMGRNTGLPLNKVMMMLIAIYSLPVLLYHAHHLSEGGALEKRLGEWRFIGYGVMLFLIAVSAGGSGEFIYFQF
ncbi:MAG: MBOAT family O-acyltransferase [Fibrobacteria bacterium]